MIALHLLGGRSSTHTAFFENDDEERDRLRYLVASFQRRGVVAASVASLEPTAFVCAEETFNPFKDALRGGFSALSAGCPPGLVFVLVDPFVYDTDGACDVTQGGLDPHALGLVLGWTRQLAGPPPSNGIVMVWTKDNAEDLRRDLADGLAMHGSLPSALRQVDITTGRPMRRYSVCVAGWGDAGAAVVRTVPGTMRGSAAFRTSPVLEAWGMKLCFVGGRTSGAPLSGAEREPE